MGVVVVVVVVVVAWWRVRRCGESEGGCRGAAVVTPSFPASGSCPPVRLQAVDDNKSLPTSAVPKCTAAAPARASEAACGLLLRCQHILQHSLCSATRASDISALVKGPCGP